MPLRDEVLARAIPQIERFLPAGDDPLVAAEDSPVLFRFPSPRGLLAVLDRGDFALTPPGVDAAFFGDLQTAFEYPWVPEFGVIALLDPRSLRPYRVRARPGWFVSDGAQIVPADDCVFVTDRAMAERLRPGMKRADATGEGYDAAVATLRARCEDYVRALPEIDARCRELLADAERHPDGVRKALAPHGLSLDDLRAPIFTLRPEQRAALGPTNYAQLNYSWRHNALVEST